MAMQIELRIADNIIGFEIPEELTAEIPNYEELEESAKQSKYWMTYEFAGTEYKTLEKMWKTDFQQLEQGKGRCDFGYNSLQHIIPSKELRNQLQEGLLFKLWEMKPVIINPKTEKARVDLTEDNKIKQEQILLGILKVELNTWVSDVLNRKPELFGKFRFHSKDLITRPEYTLQNQFFMSSLGEKDLKLMEEVAKIALEEHEKKLLSEAEQVQEKQKADKGKKEMKKAAAKKGAKDTVTAAEIEDIEAPEQPSYIVIEKNYKAGVNAYLLEKNRAKQIKMKADNAKKKPEAVDEEKKVGEEKEAAQEKKEGIRRMQKYFDMVIGQDINIILKIKMNGLEVKKKEEEPVEDKKDNKSKKKDIKKEVKKAVKKK